MIQIGTSTCLSRLLFLSDLYRSVLEVQGDILHIDPLPTVEGPGFLWQLLDEVYETPGSGRRIFCVTGEVKDGEVILTVPESLASVIDTGPFVIALVYFDNCGQDCMSRCLEMIAPWLTRGSVLGFSMTKSAAQTAALSNKIGIGSLSLVKWHHSREYCYAVI